ncbi:MAG: hypothetical protein CL920_25820 [Deltaproteobacteria bacterium]|nr:hypothetical protein [Deltaproteobacteria bacterium]MBU52125.1 hypothetical protein [Deltaproteobacteria bacterium]|tara:strand:- start:7724 stop:9028 length:1305 start_codon:yes stop_codon:yes gene_type:complete
MTHINPKIFHLSGKFLHKSLLADDEIYLRAMFFFFSALCCSLGSLLLLPLYGWIGAPKQLLYVLFTSGLLYLTLPPLCLKLGYLKSTGYIICGLYLVSITGLSLTSGRIYSEFFDLLFFLPLLTVLYLDTKGSILFGVLGVGAATLLFVVDTQLLPQPHASSPSSRYTTFVVVLVSSMIGSIFFHKNQRNLKAQAKENQNKKNEFITRVSHELRTPLTSIKGALQLLEHTDKAALSPQGKQLLSIANRNSEQLHRLINNLLDFQATDQSKAVVQTKVCHLQALLQDSLKRYEPAAQSKNSGITLDMGHNEHVHVTLDPDVFKKVVDELLSNAIKFSWEESQIRISVHNNSKELCIRVVDQGPGIPTEFQPQLFDQFTKTETHVLRTTSGLGLGLSLSKRLIENMGGQLSFKSENGSGSTFCIHLPSAMVQQSEA